MNIEAYDAESLRKIVRLLEYEDRILKDKLKKENIPYDEINPFEETIENAEEYDLDQGARIVHPTFTTEKMAIRFFSMFGEREDVYARCGKNGGYFHNVKTDGMIDFAQSSYEVSATPKRGDYMDKIIYMMLGPLRHRFTALERAEEQGIGHYFVPRYTRVIDIVDSRMEIIRIRKMLKYGYD